ncbi:DNA-repair protein [Eubacteriales bacterium]|nr:DEAD/DEAH box helicase family protein [Faecalicatena sp. BF-R-105]GKH52211.1 DNA-repair protein [Eubacteriales bacterium]GKH64931.1 DNA-repair protein [Eubacteriales bacterium]
MGLNDIDIKTSYSKTDNDIASEFYLPCMRNAIRYDRISGYFGSTIYIIAWDALKDFISNGGKMQLICSPYISEEDQSAMSEGYSARNNTLIAASIKKEVEALFSTPTLSAPSRLLAYLVSEDIIDIKIAIVGATSSPNVKRLFHDKVGIFADASGMAVGFRGSMNETYKGLSSDGNIESIDAFPNWVGDRDRTRLEEAQAIFNRLWVNSIDNVTIYDFPSAAKNILKEKSKGYNWEELLDEIKVTEDFGKRWCPFAKTVGKKPRPHQIEALNGWEANGRRGIFEHATGSGKTFTAICAINDALNRNESILILVPSCALLTQWHSELLENLRDDNIFYLLCGDDNSEWKRQGVLSSWSAKGKQKRIIITTMDTACTSRFLSNITQGEHLFIIADEMHRLGSPKRRKVLSINAGARLGLSATPRRYGDAEGTSALFNYFDGIIPPAFTLDDAIHANVLTRYFYHPQKLCLIEKEQAEWNEITARIGQLVARNSGSAENTDANAFNNPSLKRLLIQRARIVKNASGKVGLAIQVLRQHYKVGQKWIVYCDNIDQLKAVLEEAVAANFDAYEYYADMRGDRDVTLSYFSTNGGVLVSIKCLDEGVDIPSTTHALILASSQNPREFIQRRGRILRKAENKHFAHLYDAITIPHMATTENDRSLSIIAGELSRAIEFGCGAENPACITDLKNIAIDYKLDYNKLKDGGIEEDEE